MIIEELRHAVRSLPGVASVDVTPQVGAPPLVRVWTDGTVPDVDVRRSVERLVSTGAFAGVGSDAGATGSVLESRDYDDLPPTEPIEPAKRRGGLGRSLVETLPHAFAEREPSHLATEERQLERHGRFLRLAIEETSEGVDIRAIDDLGSEAEAVVKPGPDGLTIAVASAVAHLRGFPAPSRVATNTRDVDGTTVVTVLLELSTGEKAAGAAIVTGGLPFTVGRAVDSALAAL
ncbi:MAG: hypothetical protein WCC01_10655 [Acidimicrobiia bacterium]